MSGAELLVGLAYGWLAIGALVALLFLSWGVDRIVADAREVYLFRTLVAPGVILLWPLVLYRWRQKLQGSIAWQDHHTPKRQFAGRLEVAMAVALLLILALSVILGAGSGPYPEPTRLGTAVTDVEAIA